MVKNLSFWGSSKDSIPSLNLLSKSFNIKAIITVPDRSKGRGKKLVSSPVKRKAEELNIKNILTPEKLDNKFKNRYFNLDIDIAIVVAYGLLIPKKILDFPEYNTLNLHFSILPRWRGACPVRKAILEGDSYTGTSIIKLIKKMDAGPVYSIKKMKINKFDYAWKLRRQLANIGAKQVIEVIKNIENIKPVPQDETKVTYANKICKDDGKFSWEYSSIKIFRMVKAYTPWPSVFMRLKDIMKRRIILTEVEPADIKSNYPGRIERITKEGIFVGCGDNKTLILKKIKPAGKREMSAYDFANGARLKNGCILK